MHMENQEQPIQPQTPVQPTESPVKIKRPLPKLKLIAALVLLILVLTLPFGGYLLLGKLGIHPKPSTVTIKTTAPTPTPNPTANWKTYTNTKYGFSFKYPSELNGLGSYTDPKGELVSLIQDSYGGQPKMEVYISTGSAATAAQTFLNQIISTKKGLENFNYTQISTEKLDNQTLYFYSEDFDFSSNGLPPPGQPMNTLAASNTISNVFYNIRYHYLPKEQKSEQDLFNKILSTFKFTQ